MTSLETPPPAVAEPAIAVNGSKIQAVAISLALAAITVVGAISSLLSFVRARDVAGMMIWLRSSDFLQVVAALSLLGGTGGIIARSLLRKLHELRIARRPDNQGVYVKGEDAPPPVRAPEPETPRPAGGDGTISTAEFGATR